MQLFHIELIRRGFICSCSARSKIEVVRIRQRAFHFERLKLCLISAVVVLLVHIEDIICRVPVSPVWW